MDTFTDRNLGFILNWHFRRHYPQVKVLSCCYCSLDRFMCWKLVPWCGSTEVTRHHPPEGLEFPQNPVSNLAPSCFLAFSLAHVALLHMPGSLPASLLWQRQGVLVDTGTVQPCCLDFPANKTVSQINFFIHYPASHILLYQHKAD